jgi:hypothetical protein
MLPGGVQVPIIIWCFILRRVAMQLERQKDLGDTNLNMVRLSKDSTRNLDLERRLGIEK